MKTVKQNVLAQNSNGTIAYICGKCGKIIEKEDIVCKHCGVRLGDIRCPFCNFTGTVKDFRDDTCPKCGRKNDVIDKKNRNSNKKIKNISNNSFLFIKKDSFLSKKIFWILFTLLSIISGILVVIFLFYY